MANVKNLPFGNIHFPKPQPHKTDKDENPPQKELTDINDSSLKTDKSKGGTKLDTNG